MIRLLRRLIDGPDDGLPAQLARLKQATADLQKPRYVYAEPERDEIKPSCCHIYGDADLIALELKREREQQAQPKNVRVFARSVRS